MPREDARRYIAARLPSGQAVFVDEQHLKDLLKVEIIYDGAEGDDHVVHNANQSSSSNVQSLSTVPASSSTCQTVIINQPQSRRIFREAARFNLKEAAETMAALAAAFFLLALLGCVTLATAKYVAAPPIW
jgi:hypothetical protein